MSFERMPGPIGAEPAPPVAATEGSTDASRAALRLQVLATEHWGLLATRSLVWNELFTRAGMFLSTLSGATVALALVAQATEFGDGFFIFALVLLPVVLFIGVTTFIRLGQTNHYEAMCVIGMNRIRHAYLQLTPEVEPFLVMKAYDDEESVDRSAGVAPGTHMVTSVIVSTPFLVGIINGVVGGAIGAVIAQQLNLATPWAIGSGVIGFLFVFAGQGLYGSRDIAAATRSYRPLFPAPTGDGVGERRAE